MAIFSFVRHLGWFPHFPPFLSFFLLQFGFIVVLASATPRSEVEQHQSPEFVVATGCRGLLRLRTLA